MKIRSLTKRITAFLFTSILLCANTVPVYASSTSVTNNGRIGAVDIELHQSFPAEQTALLPGQTVSVKSSVENKDQPAWIRVKIEYPASDKEGLKELDDDLITFADGAWEKIGPYYYLKEPVDTGATVPFTEAIQFPGDWDNSMVNATLGMVFTAEAIQEKNFNPDFTSDDPWHGAVIEAFDGTDYTAKEEGNEQFSIIYKNGSEGLVHTGDDFFANWSDLMPGDELDGEALIENQMKLPVEIYFSMESYGNQDLMNKIGLTITNGLEIVYDGPLSSAVDPVLLKRYQQGDSTDFKYHLSVPPEITNVHALSEFKVTWTFSAKEIPPEKKPKTIIEVIKTGEYNFIIGVAGLILIAGSAGMLYRKKRRAGS